MSFPSNRGIAAAALALGMSAAVSSASVPPLWGIALLIAAAVLGGVALAAFLASLAHRH
jgi:hypothetical protein